MGRSRHAKRLLSSRNLDDVPVNVRIGSPYDAPNNLVYKFVSRGFLHPSTNYAVVYRVAFAPVMEGDEQPAPPATLEGLQVEGFPTNLLLRAAFVFPPDAFTDEGDSVSLRVGPRDLARRLRAWVLLTNRGVRWHFTGDGAPQVHPGLEPDLGGGVRFLSYEHLRGDSTHATLTIGNGNQVLQLDHFYFGVGGKIYGFAFSGGYAPENLRWYDFVRGTATAD